MSGEFTSLYREMSGDAEKDRRNALRDAAQKQGKMQDIAETYGAYRPEVNQARMNALGNRMSAFQGVNNAMATLYGKSNAPGFSQLMQNPMSPTMMRQGNPYFTPGELTPMSELENLYGPGRVPTSAMTQERQRQGMAYGTNPSWSRTGTGKMGTM